MFPIPWQKLREGAKLCRDNAVTLAECALYIFKEYPTIASFLTILAMEEIGKGIFLLGDYEKGNDLTEKEWKKLSKGRNAHIRKLKIVHTALKLSVKLEEIKEFQHKLSSIAKQVNELKLEYFYVDWNEKEKQWMSPTKKEAFVEPISWQVFTVISLLSKKLKKDP